MRSSSRSFSLRNALIVVVLLPLLAVFGAGGYVVLTTLEEQLEARLEEDIALIARTLKEPLARSLESRQNYSLYQALQSTSEFNRVYGVYLYDANGALIARAGRRPTTSTSALTGLQISGDEETAEYGSVDGRRVYSYFAPLTDGGGQVIGMLQVARRASEIRDYVDALRRSVTIAMIAFCLLFVSVVTLGHHVAIGRPLRSLGDAMDRVASGDDRARAVLRGPVEIRRLARRFNLMLDGVAERDRVLSDERALKLGLKSKLRESEQYALVGRLASGVAHQLGAPLSVVDGQAQRLMRRKRPSSEEHEMLTSIRAAASRMAAILQRLLGFGRESAAPPRPVPLERIVSLAVADVCSHAEEMQVEIGVMAGPKCVVRADGGRLREALVHLLRNAVHAADGGHVRVGWELGEGTSRIFVENSGKPLSSEERERIFEPFFTTKAPGDGSGLGLAIVKGTVIDHGGEIVVYESELGGAGFRIEFPEERGEPA